jgi:hypothetical protein
LLSVKTSVGILFTTCALCCSFWKVLRLAHEMQEVLSQVAALIMVHAQVVIGTAMQAFLMPADGRMNEHWTKMKRTISMRTGNFTNSMLRFNIGYFSFV